ncbi:uncharacterized protein [Apostichopus japonicus]|uniref:uncharacterized protein n=1 Tax=Stichopus japonicus TaxID=307972 RepID=UPI003AB7B6FC
MLSFGILKNGSMTQMERNLSSSRSFHGTVGAHTDGKKLKFVKKLPQNSRSRGNYTTPRVSWSEERNLVPKAATGYGPKSRKTFCVGMIFPPVHFNGLLSTSSRRAG